MYITAVNLFFASAVFMNSIGMISSQARTIEDLFPGYNGVMPPVEELRFQNQIRNFSTFAGRSMFVIPEILFRRDHIIFGWHERGFMGNLSRLFGMSHLYIVFNTNIDQWVTLPENLSRKLGVHHRLEFVIARDGFAATHVSTYNDPVYNEAHIRARRQADNRMEMSERRRGQSLDFGSSQFDEAVERIKGEYNDAYDRAFMFYLNQDG